MKDKLIELIREVSIADKTYPEYIEAVAEYLISKNLIKSSFEQYREIIMLHKYCLKIGVECELEKLFDGYAIRFKSGGDFIQHHGSYGCNVGCVEPAIGCRLDYRAVPLKNAMVLVRRHKDRLNKSPERSENA